MNYKLEPRIIHSTEALSELRGVYFLLLGPQIVYIGQATNVIVRIEIHQREGKKEFDRFFWVPVPDHENLTKVEAEYIWQFNPVYNEVLPPNDRYKQERELRKIWRAWCGTPLPRSILSSKGVNRKLIAKKGGMHFDIHSIFEVAYREDN